ncbi:MAG: tRNA (adenosine(37)-N6)-dimethylallyltransferase MiaA [Puniceicoccales bacterium]|jgi:tRNA dimethylallyltransferase|nr:tRNA (adenosine(37)-N6)-dimethylallyltransferase MiaA [Puniceicoccales bacterium]
MERALWFLTGYTAVGKTALSLALAHFLDAEILSCDSVQVYRGADIGSAKIMPESMADIPHHGLNLCNPNETFDIGQYVSYAQSVANQVKNKNLLVVGGAGFYLKSFFTPVIDGIAIPECVRREAQLFYENFGLAALQRAIGRYGSVDLNVSDWHNPRRLVNILAKQRVTGLAQGQLKQKFLQNGCPFDHFSRKVMVLERHSESLDVRIRERVDEMFRLGLIEEVRNLGEMCPPLARAIGYREVKAYLDGGEKMDEAALKMAIVEATRHLVKKQRTWFRRQIPVDFHINLDAHSSKESFDFIAAFCRNNGIWT